jgi:hypothetical protein
MEPGVTCLSESTLVGLLERRLPSKQREEIDAHLDACASCRRVVVDLTAVLAGASTAAEDHTTHPARGSDHGPALELGVMVGRFVALELIGRGGMGTVYTAYDPELDRYIALKLLHHQARTVTGDRARAQILAEAQAMARISHPGVVAIYEVGTFRDRVFAAMELVEGTTLRAWITEQARSWREVVAVFLLAGEGLAAAHAAGVVHRDFKPENVLLGRDGRVKVSDFGLSSLSPEGDGTVAGTPGYLPVEALRGEGVDHRADQFAFCVALCEALHGRRPFSAQTADDLASEVRRGPVFDRRTRGVPKRLDQIVRRGLAFAPEDRYASMRELLDALRRTASRRSARRAAAVLVAAVVLGAVAVLTAELAREHGPAVDPSVCERSPEPDMASAWSPALHASLTQRFAESPGLGDWHDELDGFAARWVRDNRGRRDAAPERAATAVAASVPGAALPGTARSSGRNHEPPVRVPPRGAVSATARCNKANFAALCEAASPRSYDVHAALRNLKACRDAGAITESDFERYQTALVAKL